MLAAIGGVNLATWSVAALATAGVILHPWKLPEALWAVLGALVLVLTGLLPWRTALGAVGEGTDVYLFLLGMMLLSEVARRGNCSTGSPPMRCDGRAARPGGSSC